MGIVEKALIFAAEAHNGARRKGSALPYIVHPAECVAIASSMTDLPEVLAAAALHDTIEDTDVTEDQLRLEFGDTVTDLVCFDSEDKMSDRPAADTWKQRKQATIDSMKNASDQEKIIIMADKLSNLRSMRNDYMRTGDALWERFNQKDKMMHKWYYESILESLDVLKDTCAYQEYTSLLKQIF